jgi:DNA-directed RNA polymerase specialized sigma24 family protein
MSNNDISNNNTERQLIAALKKHQYSAFEDFYDLYAPVFFGTIKRTLYKEDVSQETLKSVFNTIWTSIDSYDPSKERLFTWAMRISGKEISAQKIDIVLKELFYCQEH